MCIYLYLKRFTHDCPDTLPGFEKDAIENANAFTQESKRMQDIYTILHIAIHCIYIYIYISRMILYFTIYLY